MKPKLHPLRHGDRVAYAAGPTVRKLELTKHGGHYDLGTVVLHTPKLAIVIWDETDVNVDDVMLTGLLWSGRHLYRDGCAYAVVTPESRRTTRETRRWRAAAAQRHLDRYLARWTVR